MTEYKGEPRDWQIRIKPKEKMSRVCNGQVYIQAWGNMPHAINLFQEIGKQKLKTEWSEGRKLAVAFEGDLL